PFFIPILQNLDTLGDLGGASMIIDDLGMVLYHQDPALVGSFYEGEIDLRNPISDPQHTAPDGTREILYQEPVPGQPWVVITSVPLAVVQSYALQTSLPLFGLLLLLLVVMFVGMRLMLKVVTGSIGNLAVEAQRISSGDLDHSLESERVDEVGLLANSLDEMRLNLRARIEENVRLLSVSSGVASALEMEMAVNPILKGALSIGASSARLVLAETALPDYEQDTRTEFGLGDFAEFYKNLDKQILNLTMQQPEVILTNPSRARLNNPGNPLPESILAVALFHENVHYGALWVGFDKPHDFTEDERRFMKAVAGQAALAASNARLYLSELLGRQRMEAILESTPEPVLVTDYQDHLFLVNRAAQILLGNEKGELEGKPVEDAVQQSALRTLLVSKEVDEAGKPPVEITFPDGRVFFGTASPVQVDDQKMGRIVILRDITHYKELDALKSDFVDTVNHDLRSPLTTMRGYATMLDMVGDLNEQQTRYVQKIVEGVENMSRLVNTLLDLGRIEAGVGLQLERLPVNDVIRQVAEAMRMKADQRKINYHLHIPDSTIPLVEADQALIERAVQNLIDNAIKYSDPDGDVHITLKLAENEQIAIEVEDNGIGVSPVDLPRLFERFYRANSRKSLEERGSGLGLAIVKSIAERHNGSVSVESQLGKGSKFTFKIPINQPKA
ncbi:MAG TPA: ATP-binding protein, partial [Anaerolineales bacterium]|nr:ATP-binding protein [Anaerolineales bacterium]